MKAKNTKLNLVTWFNWWRRSAGFSEKLIGAPVETSAPFFFSRCIKIIRETKRIFLRSNLFLKRKRRSWFSSPSSSKRTKDAAATKLSNTMRHLEPTAPPNRNRSSRFCLFSTVGTLKKKKKEVKRPRRVLSTRLVKAARGGRTGGAAARSDAPAKVRTTSARAAKRETRRKGGEKKKCCKVVPFLFDRLLRLRFSLHLTWPLWAPDARLLFPSTDAISAASGAQRRNNLDSAARLSFVLVSLQPPLLSDKRGVLRLWRRLGTIFSALPLSFFLSLIPPNQGGARLAVPISPLKTPARLQLAERTVSSAAWQLSAALIPGAPSPLLLSDSFFSFFFRASAEIFGISHFGFNHAGRLSICCRAF